MVVIDTFSKRMKRMRGEVNDVYVYDELPQKLRVQVVQILQSSLKADDCDSRNSVTFTLEAIVKTVRSEHGTLVLPPRTARTYDNYHTELVNFILKESDFEKCMDAVEISFRVLDKSTRYFDYLNSSDFNKRVDNALSDLNQRFKENGVGYQYVDGEIIRVDSELIHAEVVKPALRLLNSKEYKGAQDEFLGAYEHYRHGKNKEALVDCLKAFESTMKAICDKRKWTYDKNATAKPLIDVCYNNGLVPSFWQSQLGSLRSLLESSIPTGRNKMAGHGQGTTPTVVPDYIVAYMLHMTASTLVFLIDAEKALP